MTPADARPERAVGRPGDPGSSPAVPESGSAAGDSMPPEPVELAAGQLRIQTRLGTTAVYRVLEWDEELVQVEVVTAPGLDSGMTLSLTRESVSTMPVDGG